MVNARCIARFGVLAAGLSVGLAVAATPVVAVADSSTDWLGDLFGGAALPAPVDPDLNLAISIDGYSLFSDGTASADSGSGDIAIAYGDGATAYAVGGPGDIAVANVGAAYAEGGTGDFALADGLGANALAGGVSGDDYDSAIDIGTNHGGFTDGAFAGNGDLLFGGGTGSDDTAIVIGNSNNIGEGSYAGGGGLLGGSGNGNGDTAIDIGNNGTAEAYDGDGNYAAVSGNDSAAITGNGGDNNVADVIGIHSTADAGMGNDNIGFVFDPAGTDGSVATAGLPGDSDLSAIFGDGFYSDSATGGNFLYDIVSQFGDLPGSAAATSGGFLSELLALF